jgi:hypothetical protein
MNLGKGPYTLPYRRVRYGVSAGFICQPDPRPGIKTRSSPAAFPTTLSLHFSPSTLLIRTPSCLRPRRALPSPACPLPPPKDTTWPVRKCLSAIVRFDSFNTPVALFYRPSDCGSDLDDDAEERARIFRSPATWSRDGLRCRTPAILLKAS